MKVYSLYLSTLTGSNVASVFNATVNGTTLTVPANGVVSGSVAPNQYVVVNGVVNEIVYNGTGTGGAGTYILASSVSTTVANTYIGYFPTGFNNLSQFNDLILSASNNTNGTITNSATVAFITQTVGFTLTVGMTVYGCI